MYHVPATPRPPLVRFLAHCIWYGASRGALYGLACGTGYGLFFLLIGAIFGAPIGLVFGAAVGALDGGICCLILYQRRALFTSELDSATLTARAQTFRAWMGAFSALACLLSGYLVVTGGRLQALPAFLNEGGLFIVVIPSLIAGICGYFATGRLLQWYIARWVLGSAGTTR